MKQEPGFSHPPASAIRGNGFIWGPLHTSGWPSAATSPAPRLNRVAAAGAKPIGVTSVRRSQVDHSSARPSQTSGFTEPCVTARSLALRGRVLGELASCHSQGTRRTDRITCHSRHRRYDRVLVPWFECALDRGCIAPVYGRGRGSVSTRGNHRQDQAALTMLAHFADLSCYGDAQSAGFMLHHDKVNDNKLCRELVASGGAAKIPAHDRNPR